MMSHKELWQREYQKALDNGIDNPEHHADVETRAIESGQADFLYEQERDRRLMERLDDEARRR